MYGIAFWCASCDFLVRCSNVATSFFRSSYIEFHSSRYREDWWSARSPVFAASGKERLKEKLGCQLNQTRIARPLDAPEIRAVGDTAIWIIEPGVVHQVEHLRPKFQTFALGQGHGFVDGEIPVVDARAAADRARCVAV